MIHNQFNHCARLKTGRLTNRLSGSFSDAFHQIMLQAKQFGIHRTDDAGISIGNRPENNAFGCVYHAVICKEALTASRKAAKN
jgi:hypothetical protein